MALAVFLRLLKKKKTKKTHIYIYLSQRIKEDASILCDSEFRA